MLIVFCKSTYEVKAQYTEHLNNIRCHILDVNHIILIVNVRTISPYFGQYLDREVTNFSDIGRTRTDFCLKLTPLVVTTHGLGEYLAMIQKFFFLYANDGWHHVRPLRRSKQYYP